MCKYCEPYKHEDNSISVDLLYDIPQLDYLCCIVGKTPISMRQHESDGLVASLNIHTPLDELGIPIRYCPICGKDLSK